MDGRKEGMVERITERMMEGRNGGTKNEKLVLTNTKKVT